jgi:electron transfer flavoprotein beta subunit
MTSALFQISRFMRPILLLHGAGNARRLEKDHGPADLLLFGKHALDGETGQVGPGVAARLGIPIVTYATRMRHKSGGSQKDQVAGHVET